MVLKRTVGMLLLVLLVLVVGEVLGAWLAARMILYPRRVGLEEAAEHYGYATPADFECSFRGMEVDAGGVAIRGWLVPASGGRHTGAAVVLIHGIGDNRVGMLSLLPVLRPMGVSIALIDLRAHGLSGGECLTYGVREREDVRAVVDWLIGEGLAEPGRVGLVGMSLGGAVALQAAADDGRIGAVVAEGAFARLRPLIYRESWRIFPLAVLATPLGIWWAERRGNFTVEEASPVFSADRVRCPVLLVHGAEDRVVPPAHARQLEAALGGEVELWLVEGVGHCEAQAADEDEYARRLRTFLGRHLLRGGGGSG